MKIKYSRLSARDKSIVKKMYDTSKGRFKRKVNPKQWIRKKDIDEAIYYPKTKIK